MDQPTESISPHDPPSRHDHRWLARPERRQLPQGAVRTMHVVMVGTFGQHQPQLPASHDEQPVQHLAPNGAHPPLRTGVCSVNPQAGNLAQQNRHLVAQCQQLGILGSRTPRQ